MAALATIACSLSALLLPTPPPAQAPLSRRGAVQAAGASFAAAVLGAQSATAAEPEFSKMGGLLEPYIDTQRGFKFYKPTGWNQFDADPGVYDIKYQDIIEPETTVQVSTSPVATATSISALGDLQAVGAKFAKSRSAELVSASERKVEDSLVYTIELKGELYHELIALCINRGKLYRVTAVTSNKKWNRRAELYKNIVASFVPKGF